MGFVTFVGSMLVFHTSIQLSEFLSWIKRQSQLQQMTFLLYTLYMCVCVCVCVCLCVCVCTHDLFLYIENTDISWKKECQILLGVFI